MNAMTDEKTNRPSLFAAIALMSAGAVMATGILLVAGTFSNQDDSTLTDSATSVSTIDDLMKLHADSAARGKSLSMATGFINSDIEGIFVLDHLTGLLQCWIIGPRTSKITAVYRADVATAMGLGQVGEADYVMITGQANFKGGNAGNMRPGNCVCYIADTNSGKIACFGIVFNEQNLNQGQVPEGELVLLDGTTARGQTVERDQ